jgi:hypothetical protein
MTRRSLRGRRTLFIVRSRGYPTPSCHTPDDRFVAGSHVVRAGDDQRQADDDHDGDQREAK